MYFKPKIGLFFNFDQNWSIFGSQNPPSWYPPELADQIHPPGPPLLEKSHSLPLVSSIILLIFSCSLYCHLQKEMPSIIDSNVLNINSNKNSLFSLRYISLRYWTRLIYRHLFVQGTVKTFFIRASITIH